MVVIHHTNAWIIRIVRASRIINIKLFLIDPIDNQFHRSPIEIQKTSSNGQVKIGWLIDVDGEGKTYLW